MNTTAEKLVALAREEAAARVTELEQDLAGADARIEELLQSLGELLAHVERGPAGVLTSASVRDTIARYPAELRRVVDDAEDEARAAKISGASARLARAS